MGFNAHVLRVLIASPGDVQTEREAVADVIFKWDATRAESAGLLFLPTRWETDAVPQLIGFDGQTVINQQLTSQADVVIAFFHSRLGAPTPRAESGTAEELRSAEESGTPVHVYFSRSAFPHDANTEQINQLRAFREGLHLRGLVGDFNDVADLREQVMAALESDVRHYAGRSLSGDLPLVARQRSEKVELRASYLCGREQRRDTRGKVTNHTRNSRIRVENLGDGLAGQVSLTANLVSNEPTIIIRDAVTPDIAGKAFYDFSAYPNWDVSGPCELTMKWQEDGEEKSFKQTVSLM